MWLLDLQLLNRMHVDKYGHNKDEVTLILEEESGL